MVKPKGARANSWADIADLSASLGVTLDGWQELILEAAMGERTDRTWAAKRVGITVPRQNGKSQLLVARALAGALLFGEKKIVVSAHQQDTARESFAKLMEIIEDDANTALAGRVRSVMNALNREAVTFTNGAKIQFKARSGAAGKGFSSDCLLLDEAQILGSRAWTSINSTMSAMRNPQVWLLGTPPQDEDDCYAFEMVRKAALDGKSTAAAWVEWSADPTAEDFDPASEYTRWSANPAWNTRINHEVVQGEFETYTAERFAQDRLGIWRSDDGKNEDVFGPGLWAAGSLDAMPDVVPAAIGLAVSVDRTRASIAAAVVTEVEDQNDPEAEPSERLLVAAVDYRPDVGWLAAEAKRLQDTYDCAVILDGKGPTNDLAKDLEDLDVAFEVTSTDEYAEACSRILDKVRAGLLLHFGDALDEAAEGAQWRAVGDRQVWGRRKSASDVSMLEAATLAARAAEMAGAFNIS